MRVSEAGPKRTQQYHSGEFKAAAVASGARPHLWIKDVAEALATRAFMLSRWRKEAREGRIVAKKRLPDIN
ncbi:MAG: transposase [Chromatiaceae bacterium]|nr:transposase [Chromatiaceae bacterium]